MVDNLAKHECKDIALWHQSIVNHLFRCAATAPDGDGDVMKAKRSMLPLHIKDIHEEPDNELHPERAMDLLKAMPVTNYGLSQEQLTFLLSTGSFSTSS